MNPMPAAELAVLWGSLAAIVTLGTGYWAARGWRWVRRWRP